MEITEEAFSSYLNGDWLKMEGRYDLEAFRDLLEKNGRFMETGRMVVGRS